MAVHVLDFPFLLQNTGKLLSESNWVKHCDAGVPGNTCPVTFLGLTIIFVLQKKMPI